MTNFEKIKSMSIEEMAVLLHNPKSVFSCDDCPQRNSACTPRDCLPNIRKWLESEVE